MTNINDNRDQTPLELHLGALRTDLQQTLKRTKARRKNMLIGMIVVVVLMGCYWTFIYTKLARIDSDYVADLAYGRVQSYLDKSPQLLETQLREHAPDLFNYAQERVLQTPAMGSAYIRDTFLDQTKGILAQAQPQFDQAINDAIDQAKAGPGGAFDTKDPAQVDKFIDALALQIHQDSQKTIDKVYADYDRQAQVLVDHIQTLAIGKNLDALQEHHRQVIISFLALNEKWKTNPPELISSSSADGGSLIPVANHPDPTPAVSGGD